MLQFDDSTIAKNKAVAAEYFKAYYPIAYREKKFSGGTIGFIPFNIEFTVDGLSGIKIYNKLRIDTSFLPNEYPLTLDFIVTGIEHKLNDGDWETLIKVTLIPRLEPTEVVVTSANFKAQIYPPQIKTAPVVVINSNTLPGGPGLDPIKNLIASKESNNGDYDIYNFGPSGGSGIKTTTPGSKYFNSSAIKLTDKTITQIIALQSGAENLFALGKFQTIPNTLKSVATSLGLLNALFDQSTQEKIGDYLLLTSRPPLGNYLKGTNGGSASDLSSAVQSLGQEFASLPIITKGGVTFGDVNTGIGNKAYYGGSGPNPDTVNTSVAIVVKALIKSRIQYSSKQPSFIPSYYNL